MVDPTAPPPDASAHADALRSILSRFFQTSDGHVLAGIEARVAFRELAAGETLFRQGERSDEIYFVLGGRLRAVRTNARGKVKTLGEIGRGETVGELALITGEARSASIVAIRDTLLARLSRTAFEAILAAQPSLSLAVARLAIDRLRRAEQVRQPVGAPVAVCLLPVTAGVDALGFSEALHCQRADFGGPVRVISAAMVAERFGYTPGQPDAAWQERIAAWLAGIEATCDSLILVADREPTAWTAACLQHADEILLLADADTPAALSEAEIRLLVAETGAPHAVQSLILLHPADRRSPAGTARWLDRRPVARHFHIRQNLAADMRRLARTLAGQAIGVVLSGGGARALAHFGVLKALSEAGVEPDFIGGVSMGATVAAWRAMGLTGDALLAAGRKAYLDRPTGDYNILPVMALIGGARVRRLMEEAVLDATGSAIGIEDTWLPFYCIASDLSASEEAVLTRGTLSRALLASVSIPGALPPVLIGGHLMLDGGAFNNFPVDVMERLGVGTVIGVDMANEQMVTHEQEELPGGLALLIDRFRPFAKRRYRLPLLPEILLNATLIASINRQRLAAERVDILFRPKITRVGLLDWRKYDRVVAMGYDDAKAQLAAMGEDALAKLR